MLSERIRGLEEQLKLTTDPKQRISLLLDICADTRLYDIEQAEQLGRQALELSLQEDYKLGIGRSWYAIGSSLWQKGEYAASVELLTKALKLAFTIDDLKLKGKSNNMLGNVHRDMGELSLALNFYLQAQIFFDELGEQDAIGVVLMNIALTFFALAEYESALDYALRSVAILEQTESSFRQFSIYHALGDIYFKQNELDNALTHFYKALELTQQETGPHALALSGIGKTHLLLGDNDKAANYLKTASEIAESNHFIESYIVSNFYLGRLHMIQQNYDSALTHYKLALDSAVTHGRRHDQMSVHEFLALCYESLGDKEEAYTHLKKYDELRRDIFEVEEINRIRNKKILDDISVARKEKELAQRTASVKQQFLANMSHEIRTPMNAIVGMTRMLLNKEHLPSQEKYLKAIKSSADNLLVIINDILDISKLEAGKFQIENIPFSLRTMVNGVYNTLRIKAAEKELEFTTEVEQAIPDVLVGDPTRLSQVLINLAGNAIKFTDQGFVKVKVVSKKTTSDKVSLKIEVIDSGIGIDETFVHNLFTKFTQAGSDTARKYGGTGLGLSISKQLVHLMGGDIEATGQIGVGSTFTVELSLPISSTQKLPESAVEEITKKEISALSHKRILLVEDNEFNQMLAIDTLRDLNSSIEIVTALNGKIAVDKVSNEHFDLVLMDIQMPVMSGVEATKLIRNTLRLPNAQVPIIAMTANVLKDDIDQYLAVGMNDFVGKPFTPHVLVHKIVKYLGDYVEVDVPLSDEHKEPEQISTKVTSMTFLEGITKGDAIKQKKYIELFLKNAPQLLKQAIDSYAQKDRERLGITVHSLKGQLAYMGISENTSGVFALEQQCKNPSIAFEDLKQPLQHLEEVCMAAFAELQQILNEL